MNSEQIALREAVEKALTPKWLCNKCRHLRTGTYCPECTPGGAFASPVNQGACHGHAVTPGTMINASELIKAQQRIAALESEVERLKLYERAWQSMADQFICPKMTAEELAKRQLGIE